MYAHTDPLRNIQFRRSQAEHTTVSSDPDAHSRLPAHRKLPLSYEGSNHDALLQIRSETEPSSFCQSLSLWEGWLYPMQRTLVFAIFLVLCSSSALLSEAAGLGYAVVTFTTDKGQVQVRAEVAETPSEQEQGLMFRTVLAQDAGMLFVFDQDQLLNFWMMNTSISLDGIFISSQLRVVFVAENLKPCPPSNCQDPEFFDSGTPAMYALEVNAGFSAKNDIKVGTKVSINQSFTTSATITTHTTAQQQATTTTSTQRPTALTSHITIATTNVRPSPSIGFAFVVIAIGAGVAFAAGGLALAATGQPHSETFSYEGCKYCKRHRVPVWYVQGLPWCPVEGRFLRQ
jgi:uncharacterized membrane protein (UPF0127 family)